MQTKRPNIKIDQTKFNRAFDLADQETRERKMIEEENEETVDEEDGEETVDEEETQSNYNSTNQFEPRKYTEDLGINMKNLFFDVLEMLANGQNPIPYIMKDTNKQFIFAIMIILIGVLLLFFSNLMI